VRTYIAGPDALAAQIMGDVGRAAAQGQAPSNETLSGVEQLAAGNPLNAEPFLVHAAIALKNGYNVRAERLLIAARQRAPRSPAARYLLGDLYIRTARPVEAMTEMAVLNRLVPSAGVQLAPALAEYARSPGAVAQVRSILASYPELEVPVLAVLSSEPRNADLILSLASQRANQGPAPDWQRLMLTTLVNSGEYDRAYAIWRKLANVPDLRAGFYNPDFTDKLAPGPFNWQFAQGAGGVAEPSAGGGLQVIYFGRDSVDLAQQVLLLPAGSYRLAVNVSGDLGGDGSIGWKVTCVGANRELFRLPLTGSGTASGQFAIPADCKAQRIALAAEAPEVPDAADFRISGLQLTRLQQ
jgi:hypothetical protein